MTPSDHSPPETPAVAHDAIMEQATKLIDAYGIACMHLAKSPSALERNERRAVRDDTEDALVAWIAVYVTALLASQSEVRRLSAVWLRYCSDDTPHDRGCAVYDAVHHGDCDCGSEALTAALRNAAISGSEQPANIILLSRRKSLMAAAQMALAEAMRLLERVSVGQSSPSASLYRTGMLQLQAVRRQLTAALDCYAVVDAAPKERSADAEPAVSDLVKRTAALAIEVYCYAREERMDHFAKGIAIAFTANVEAGRVARPGIGDLMVGPSVGERLPGDGS